jgi:hypothetical protein
MQIEELLIDFRELVGEHLGENMAQAVFKTIELYGLKGCVRHSISVQIIK